MAKDRKIAVKTKFDNGSVSFTMSDGRLIKLSKSAIDDLKALVAGHRVGGDSVSLFQQYYLGSNELICGPNNEVKESWGKSPLWEHQPYMHLYEVIICLGLLTKRDFSALADFVRGCEWRHASSYWGWRRQHLDPGYYESRNPTGTILVSEEEFAAMKGGG